jgi:GTP pyrophosphokinase
MPALFPERVIEVDWGDSTTTTYPEELLLYANDRQGLLRDISTVLSDEKKSVLTVCKHEPTSRRCRSL